MPQIVHHPTTLPRRTVLHLATTLLLDPQPAHAGLVLFPANRLNNQYFLIRAAESVCEAEGRVCTNPAFKTSLSSGLSTQGRRQVCHQHAHLVVVYTVRIHHHQVARSLYPALEALGASDGSVWLWPSIHLGAYQTAEILAAFMDVGRSRIVPEYSFLDPRGVGGLDNRRYLVVWMRIAVSLYNEQTSANKCWSLIL